MLRRILLSIGAAALALTMNTGVANAQRGHGGGHAVGHAGGHVAVAPRGGYARPAVAYNRGAYVNRGAYLNHGVGYRYGYGYHNYYRPYYRNFYGLGLGLGLGYPYYYGNYYSSYPYYGYSYPYDYGAYYGSDYVAPQVIAPDTTTSAYPPADTALSNSAEFTVQLPPDASLWIDGQLTQQTGPVRTIVTPPTLDPGRSYTYHLRAQWVQDGQTVVRDRDISFQAGSQLVVNMTVP